MSHPEVPDRRALVRCVETATLAPSLHNSQPWLFRIVDETIEVHADPARQLDVLDPAGRELMISLGAAVFTLRVAVRREGWIPEVATFPDPEQPRLVARVRAGRPAEPSADARELAAAVGRRHTSRRPFTAEVVPAGVIDKLRRAAELEGATLTVAGSAARGVIVGLGRDAELRQRRHGGYFAQLGGLTRGQPGGHLPTTAVGPWDALERTPMRDFGVVRPQPSLQAGEFDADSTLAVLTTDGDGPPDWLRAGQALQRVLLVATAQHLSTTPVSRPVEIPAVREALSDPGSGRWAQMLVRLGYGLPAGATPRRPVGEVLG